MPSKQGFYGATTLLVVVQVSLTTTYLEKLSTNKRYDLLFSSNKSVPIFSHGLSGSVDGIMGSLWIWKF